MINLKVVILSFVNQIKSRMFLIMPVIYYFKFLDSPLKYVSR